MAILHAFNTDMRPSIGLLDPNKIHWKARKENIIRLNWLWKRGLAGHISNG